MIWVIKLGLILFCGLIGLPYLAQKIVPDLDKHNKFMTHVNDFGNAPAIDPKHLLVFEPLSKDASRIRRQLQKKREQGPKTPEIVET